MSFQYKLGNVGKTLDTVPPVQATREKFGKRKNVKDSAATKRQCRKVSHNLSTSEHLKICHLLGPGAALFATRPRDVCFESISYKGFTLRVYNRLIIRKQVFIKRDGNIAACTGLILIVYGLRNILMTFYYNQNKL